MPVIKFELFEHKKRMEVIKSFGFPIVFKGFLDCKFFIKFLFFFTIVGLGKGPGLIVFTLILCFAKLTAAYFEYCSKAA